MADIEKVPYPEHPNRCQSMVGNNQCYNMAIEGIQYCPVHGSKAATNLKKTEVKNYQLALLRHELTNKLASDDIISLREEIALLRIMLEKRLNQCKDDYDLMRESTPVLQALLAIERLVTSCHKLETSLGQMLSKSSIIQFCTQVIAIINRHVEDKAALSAISLEMLGALDSLRQVDGGEV